MPATYEALSQGGHEAMATEIFTKIKTYLDTHGADSKVSKAGDTMTGVLAMKDEAIDASKSNNNISSTRYPTTFNILDTANRILSRMECVVESNGNISSYWYTRNYNTSGGQVAQKGIKMTMNKSGTLTYSVSDGEAFATAIGKYTRSSTGTLDWGSTNQQLLMTKSAVAYWNGCYSGTSSNLQYCDRGRFGTIVTKASNAYPTTTSLPSNYRIRCWTQVNNWGSVNTITPFTNSTLASKFGVTSCTGGNTFLYCIVGDAASSTWYPTWCYYTGGNWRVTFNKASASQNYRLTFFGVYFG